MISPGGAYGASGEGFFRISLTTPDDRLLEAVRAARRAREAAPDCHAALPIAADVAAKCTATSAAQASHAATAQRPRGRARQRAF